MANKNKKGLTLIETIIAIAIFVIGIEGFVLLFAKGWKLNSFILETGNTSLAASRGVQKTVDVIRNAQQAGNGAFTIFSANNNDLVIYGDIDKDRVVERLHYYISGTTLNVGITNPTTDIPPIYPAGDQITNNVASHVVNGPGFPIFSYYDINNTLLPTPATVNNIKMVKVYLEINIDPNRDPGNIVIQSYASIRNLSEYDRPE